MASAVGFGCCFQVSLYGCRDVEGARRCGSHSFRCLSSPGVASAVLSEFPSQEFPDRIVDVAFLFCFFFNKTIDLLVVICLKYTIVLVNPFWPVFIFHYVRSSETPQADEQV